MCGITGIFNFSTLRRLDQGDEIILKKMTDLLVHRGPDGEGFHVEDTIGLGHRRLSIIDIDGGKQPIFNEDGKIAVVFNGEIFNFIELRKLLLSKGHVFRTHSDTEVIVHAYEEYGLEFPKLLNGQFSIAIWDGNLQELVLVRDRVGITPLFYSILPDGDLIFSSEMKSLLSHPSLVKRIDYAGLEQIFTLWVNIPPRTIFKNIFELPPGNILRVSRTGMKQIQYWSYSFPMMRDYEMHGLSYYQKKVEEILTDSIHLRLRADVPVGAYLSGGIDSSLICGLMARISNLKFETFSLAFKNERYDESKSQDIVQRYLKGKHSVFTVDDNDITNSLQEVIRLAERPLLRTAPAPMLRLSGMVSSKNYKVVLSGEGADEIFAGYSIFKEDKIRRFWARVPDSKIRPRLLEKIHPYVGDGKNKAFGWQYFFSQGLSDTKNPFYSHLVRWNNTSFLKNFFSQEIRQQFNPAENIYSPLLNLLPRDYMGWDPLSRAQFIEATLFLPGNLLSSQGDRMLMGNSVEGRFPFLDHRLIEFAATIPPKYKLYGLEEKYILKKVAHDYVPAEILARGKHPYRAPIQKCLSAKDSGVAELLQPEMIKEFAYFDPQRTETLLGKARSEKILSEREDMALIGIASQQLLHRQFLA